MIIDTDLPLPKREYLKGAIYLLTASLIFLGCGLACGYTATQAVGSLLRIGVGLSAFFLGGLCYITGKMGVDCYTSYRSQP